VLLVLFVPVLGALIWWRTGRMELTTPIWIGGGVLTAVYWLAAPVRRLIYVGWMFAVFPIGWTVSHLLLASIFYGVVTPIGWLLRASGREPLLRTFDRSAPTYWVRHARVDDIGRYFRQY
jgi:hypothetical protein